MLLHSPGVARLTKRAWGTCTRAERHSTDSTAVVGGSEDVDGGTDPFQLRMDHRTSRLTVVVGIWDFSPQPTLLL